MTNTPFLFNGAVGTVINSASKATINASLVNLAGGTMTLTAAAANPNTGAATGLEISSGTTASYTVARFAGATSNLTYRFSFEFVMPAVGAALSFADLQDTTPTNQLKLSAGTNGQLFLANRTGVVVGTLLANPTAGTRYRVAGTLTVATATTGSVNVNVYADTGGASLGNVTASNVDLGTLPIQGAELGITNTVASRTIQIGSMQLADGAGTELPALTSATLNPTASFTFVVNGQVVSLTDTSTAGGAAITGWAWNYGSGAPINNSQNPAHSYANSGTYNVTLTVTDANGNTSSVTQPVTVVAPITATLAVSPTTVASGSSVTATASGAAGGTGTPYTYAFNFGDGSSTTAASSSTTATHVYTNTTNANVSETVSVWVANS